MRPKPATAHSPSRMRIRSLQVIQGNIQSDGDSRQRMSAALAVSGSGSSINRDDHAACKGLQGEASMGPLNGAGYPVVGINGLSAKIMMATFGGGGLGQPP